MVSPKKIRFNSLEGDGYGGSNCTKSSSNSSEVDANSDPDIEKRIYLDHSMQIIDPKNSPLKRYPDKDEIRVLIVPEKGDQTLIIFTLPKDVDGTVQDIITQLKEVPVGRIVKIFLVTDPVHNVRYVIQTNNNSFHQSQKRVIPAAKRLSHSHDGHCTNEHSNELVSSSREPTMCLKRSLTILTIYPSPLCKGSITVTADDLRSLDANKYLNDIIIDFYLKYLVIEKLSPLDQEKIHLFSSFFYVRLTNPLGTSTNSLQSSMLTKNSKVQHSSVKRWTMNVNIFEKDFVIIPIQENNDWFLAIICYPNVIHPKLNNSILKPKSKSHRPRIWIFESIPSFRFERPVVADILKNYIQFEYKAKFGSDCTLRENDFDVVFPNVPRQHNTSDCGLYLLQYAESFLKDYVADSRLPSESLGSWFDTDVIKEKRSELKKLIVQLASDSQIFKKRRTSI